MGKTAVYSGSFDPITNGHIDIINRGLKIFDKIIILVGFNPNKEALFSVEERVAMISKLIGDNPKLKVDSHSGLLVNYVRDAGADVILRGLRATLDFEYELQLALMNRRLDRDLETVFLMTGFKWFYCNSRMIKEATSLGGSVKGLVPDSVFKQLLRKFPEVHEKQIIKYCMDSSCSLA